MRTEPGDLDRAELEALLARRWSLETLEHLPVGFGSYHWAAADARGSRRFVTAHDLEASSWLGADPDAALEALDRAYRTAAVLRDEAGLEFVVAPLADWAGSLVRRLGDRYAVAVFPFLTGEPAADGVLDLVDRLHGATELVPQDLPRREDFAVPSRDSLLGALDDLDLPWTSGPFAEPARRLLGERAAKVAGLLRHYDELAAEARAAAEPWVVTHGEPHSANTIQDARGRLHLVDWDTVKLAPRERDLWMLLDRSADSPGLRLYRRWWELSEIAEYVRLFRRPHERTADTLLAWDELADYL